MESFTIIIQDSFINDDNKSRKFDTFFLLLAIQKKDNRTHTRGYGIWWNVTENDVCVPLTLSTFKRTQSVFAKTKPNKTKPKKRLWSLCDICSNTHSHSVICSEPGYLRTSNWQDRRTIHITDMNDKYREICQRRLKKKRTHLTKTLSSARHEREWQEKKNLEKFTGNKKKNKKNF